MGDRPVGPIAVGDLGGSGTRLIAEILKDVGVYVGAGLNGAKDNLWFDCLIWLPKWDLSPPEDTDQPLYGALRVFERAMTGQLEPDGEDRKVIKEAVSRILKRWKRSHYRPPEWFGDYVRSLEERLERSHEKLPAGAERWGWKLPQTHFFLEYSRAYFGARLQYVHVIRNGLYMARSRNQNQLRSWGAEYGVVEEHPGSDPSASLEFWIAANQLAIARGKEMAPNQFYLLNYDNLCSNPQQGIEQLLTFLQLEPPEPVMATLIGRARKKETRFPATDLASFTSTQLDSVRAMGFDIEESH